MLFQEMTVGLTKISDGLQKSLFESVMKCDPDIRLSLFRNIVLSGGTSMIDGMKDRFQKEMNAVCSALIAP